MNSVQPQLIYNITYLAITWTVLEQMRIKKFGISTIIILLNYYLI